MNSDNKQIRDVADVAARIMAGLPPIEEELKGGQVKIDKNHNGKIDGQDFKILRGEKKVKEEVEQQDEAMSHQAKTTMKHIPNPSPALKKAAKDIKPGVAGYRDRIDMLKAGGVKEEVEELDEISTKTLASAAHSASDPDSDYYYGKSHDPQKFADHAKKTKDAKSAAAVQGAANAKGHYPRDNHTSGYDKLAHRSPARVTSAGKANKQDVKTLKGNIQRNEEVELDEVKMADLPSTKVQGRAYGASKPQPSAFDLVKGPKDKDLKSIESEKKKKKISEMIAIYKEGGLKTFFESIKKEDLIAEEPDSEQFAKDLEDAKKRAAGTKPQPDVAKASVQAVKQEAVEQDIEVLDADLVNGFDEVNIEERTLTSAEMNKREHIVKSMKKGMAGFKDRYGDRAKSVMYATATKQAKND
jgi:hypothetical protein